MKILAIDSSGMTASVALVTEECMIGEYTVNYKKTHSQTLLPMIDELLRFLDTDINDVDAIAVSAGPGSFTGLRIGAATAKGLGLATGKNLISVSTIAGLAYSMQGTEHLICPLMDARRNQVYTGLYRFNYSNDECDMIEVSAPKAVDINEIIDEINEKDEPVIFNGDGVKVFLDEIKNKVKVPYILASINKREQSAGAVGMLALNYLKNNSHVVTPMEFEPVYLRMSQAEREYKEKHIGI